MYIERVKPIYLHMQQYAVMLYALQTKFMSLLKGP